MPIIKSAKKRVRTAEKAAIRNAKTKRSLKAAMKSFQRSVDGGDASEAEQNRRKAQSGLDTAVKKNLMHPNKVARLKRQLAAKAKAVAGAIKAPAAKAAADVKKAAKPAAKTSAAKKADGTVSKKPAMSSAAKQSAVKKTASKVAVKKPAAKKADA